MSKIAARRLKSLRRIAGLICRMLGRLRGSLARFGSSLLGRWSLKLEDRELIESAALIANVGYLINFDGHHKHSYHLIVNSELPGFERRQLQILANVARYHRGTRPKKRHENFSELSVEDQKRVCELAAILRLALRSIGRISSMLARCGLACAMMWCGLSCNRRTRRMSTCGRRSGRSICLKRCLGGRLAFTARDIGARARSKRRARPIRPGRGRTDGGSR